MKTKILSALYDLKYSAIKLGATPDFINGIDNSITTIERLKFNHKPIRKRKTRVRTVVLDD